MRREESKLREYDEQASEIISAFLELHFYSQLTTNFQRYYDEDSQFRGVDCSFEFEGKVYNCDEKAAIHYINKPLGTFAMELSFIDKGNNIHDGWLLDGEKINNSYLFCWIDKAKLDIIESLDDVQNCQIALVDRLNIINYLKNLGWNATNLKKKMDRIRTNPNENLGTIRENGVKFSKSFKLVEQPINVLITRQTLVELSDYSAIYNL